MKSIELSSFPPPRGALLVEYGEYVHTCISTSTRVPGARVHVLEYSYEAKLLK